MEKIKKICRRAFVFSGRDWIIFVVALTITFVVCFLLNDGAKSDVYAPLIFVLDVLVVSLLTEGYFYGILTVIIGVVGVNYAFTYPYMVMDFSIYGYPLTFITMMAVGIAVSALTSRVKEQERIQLEANREKIRANLLRAISHDLRTPLTSISGSISLLLEEHNFTKDQERALLQDAKTDAEWLCRMVENLLLITRIQEGENIKIKMVPELIEEVLGEAVSKFKKRNKDVRVVVSVPEDVLCASMDAILIEQVIMNLMDNSLEHGVETTLIEVKAEKKENNARISVLDNGKGFNEKRVRESMEGKSHIFEEQRGDRARNMGIGLAVCKTIVEAHGGELIAGNLPHGGAEFSFLLRLEEDWNGDQG